MLFTLTPSAPVDGYGEALLSLAAAKAWLRVDGGDEDDVIGALRDAAIDAVEQYANLRMAPVTGMIARFAGFGARMRVGIGPAAALKVTGVAYTDATGAAGALDADGWRIDAMGGLTPAFGGSWPAGASDVIVTFSVGYPAGACPPALIQAARMFLAHLYGNRAAIVAGAVSAELPLGFTMLCDRYRMPVI